MSRRMVLLLLGLLAAACRPSDQGSPSPLEKIEAWEAQMAQRESLDSALADSLILAYEEVRRDSLFSNSLRAAYGLKKARMLAEFPDRSADALEAYRWVIQEMRYAAPAPLAVLETGLLYEKYGDRSRAAGAYRYFLQNYPTHPQRQDVEGLLNMVLQGEDRTLRQVQEWLEKARQDSLQ